MQDVSRLARIRGIPQFSFTDTTGDATFTGPNNIINFFQDDTVTGKGEASSGVVNQIRIYDNALTAAQVAGLNAVPEPSTLVMGGSIAVASLAYALRRKRRAA